ncbi:syntaxin, putative [Eimeria maxima]|uniref:Syntaxin, putative n=1 Tax=Eimeria maxima TaxID=5804 RepID=U6MCE9_EIMMA|nr:syntaxin, putative [Eimeria maxima]CDJ60738.1 syntaxin, putative [Eimeria maxima]
MRDRFQELRALALQLHPLAAAQMHQGEGPPGAPGGPSGFVGGSPVDLEEGLGTGGGPPGGPPGGPQGGGFLGDYFNKVNILAEALAQIGEKIELMQDLKTRLVEATSPDDEKDVSHELHKVLSAGTTLMQKTKKAIEGLKEENKQFAAQKGNINCVAELRIRQNLQQTLAAELQQQLQLLQLRQAEYRLQVRKKAIRQVKLVYPDAVDSEIEGLVDSGELTAATAIKMKVSGTHQALKNATADIQDKYRDIRRLEQSVAELHQMFVELSFLVEAQGEMVEQIQYSVQQAKEYTAKAEKELLQARRNQKSAKARMFWISVILIIIIAIVLVPVFVTLLK